MIYDSPREVSTKPVFGMRGSQVCPYEIHDLLLHKPFIVNHIIFFVKIIGIMKNCRCHFHVMLTGKIEKRDKLFSVLIGYGNSNAKIPDFKLFQSFQGIQCSSMGKFYSSNLVMGVPDTIKTDPDTHVRMILHNFQNPLCRKSVCADDNALGFLLNNVKNIIQIMLQKRISTGYIEPDHLRQAFQINRPHFFRFITRMLPRMAHAATTVASIGYRKNPVHFKTLIE